MPLSSESATASGSDPSICHSAVAWGSKVLTCTTLCLPSSNPKEYIVKFEGNNSKKWDGREINLDGEWLESLYDPKELTSGKQLRLPWPEKEEKYWNAVLMEPKQEISSCDITYSNTLSSSKGKTTRKRKAPSKIPNIKKQCTPHAKRQKNVSTSYPLSPPPLSVLFAFGISIVHNIPVLVGTTEKPKGKILHVGG